MPTKDEVITVLKKCYDPEIPINIYDLGLVYNIDINEADGRVGVRMTLTAPGCPASAYIGTDVKRKIESLPGVKEAKVEVDGAAFYQRANPVAAAPRVRQILARLARHREEDHRAFEDAVAKAGLRPPAGGGHTPYPFEAVAKLVCYACGYVTEELPASCPSCGAARYAFEKEISKAMAWEIAVAAGKAGGARMAARAGVRQMDEYIDAKDLHACTMCGYCVPVCPAYREIGFESAAPRGKVFFMREHDKRGFGILDRLLGRETRPDAEFAKAVFECTACGACEDICMADIPFDRFWQDAKGGRVEAGLGMAQHAPVLENVRESHNIFGEPHGRRAAWLPKDAVQSPSPEAVFWVGCVASYRKQKVAEAVVKILNAARVRYRILGNDEWCSGAPLANMGFEEYVKKELMPRNIQAVAETGAKILVTACAEDVRAFLKDYRRWGGNPPFSVLHVLRD